MRLASGLADYKLEGQVFYIKRYMREDTKDKNDVSFFIAIYVVYQNRSLRAFETIKSLLTELFYVVIIERVQERRSIHEKEKPFRGQQYTS